MDGHIFVGLRYVIFYSRTRKSSPAIHNYRLTNFCLIPTDASVSFTSSTYPVNEGDGAVQVCISLYDIPPEGLECAIKVFLATTDGVKAGEYSPLNSAL